MEKLKVTISFLLLFICAGTEGKAQMITGVWTRKINQQKVEVKIILKGSVVTGNTCYYESPNVYLRYSIKGYFNFGANEAVWSDDQLIEEKGHGFPGANTSFLTSADFDCPGYGRMKLGGKTSREDKRHQLAGGGEFDNTDWSGFTDEWEFVLESFAMEANDPGIIDSADVVVAKKTIEDQPVKTLSDGDSAIAIAESTPAQTDLTKSTNTVMPIEPVKPSAIEEKYVVRKKVLTTQIPLSGDSITLHFYDNGEVDGDSISLFLNDKLIIEHIRLSDKPYSIKLSVSQLNSFNELIMVAENLGSIPPNTSYMVATVGDKRYEVRLESTEGSSAVIRLVKPTMNEKLY